MEEFTITIKFKATDIATAESVFVAAYVQVEDPGDDCEGETQPLSSLTSEQGVVQAWSA